MGLSERDYARDHERREAAGRALSPLERRLLERVRHRYTFVELAQDGEAPRLVNRWRFVRWLVERGRLSEGSDAS